MAARGALVALAPPAAEQVREPSPAPLSPGSPVFAAAAVMAVIIVIIVVSAVFVLLELLPRSRLRCRGPGRGRTDSR